MYVYKMQKVYIYFVLESRLFLLKIAIVITLQSLRCTQSTLVITVSCAEISAQNRLLSTTEHTAVACTMMAFTDMCIRTQLESEEICQLLRASAIDTD